MYKSPHVLCFLNISCKYSILLAAISIWWWTAGTTWLSSWPFSSAFAMVDILLGSGLGWVIWWVLKCFWSSLLTCIRAGSQILENSVIYQNRLFDVFFFENHSYVFIWELLWELPVISVSFLITTQLWFKPVLDRGSESTRFSSSYQSKPRVIPGLISWFPDIKFEIPASLWTGSLFLKFRIFFDTKVGYMNNSGVRLFLGLGVGSLG